MARRGKGEGSLIRRKGCRFWYASFYDVSGRQIRKSTETDIKQEALVKLRQFMGDSERGIPHTSKKLAYADIRAGLVANYVERGNKTLEVLPDGREFIRGLFQLDSYCGYIPAKDDKPCDPGIAVARITTDFARAFAKKRLTEGVGNAGVNRSLQCLRRMLNIAREDGKIAIVPKIRLLREPPARKGFLPLDQFEKLLQALPAHLRPLITLLYYCGVRVGEALQIDWKQLDLNAALIRLEEDQTKSGEARIIPLPNVLVAMLAPIEPKTGRVFDGTNLRTEWSRACAAVGLGTVEECKSEDGWTWYKYSGLIVHDLRRSAVRNLRLAGVPENVAMKISGHRTRHVFERYNIVVTDDVSQAMRAVEAMSAPQPALRPAKRRVSRAMITTGGAAKRKISAKLVQNASPAIVTS